MNKYQFKNIFNLLLVPSMLIAFPTSYLLTPNPMSFVSFQKPHLALFVGVFAIIALLIFTSLQNMIEDTLKSSKFASGAITIALVVVGVTLSSQFTRFTHSSDGNISTAMFFIYNFIIGITLAILASGLLALCVSTMLRNDKV